MHCNKGIFIHSSCANCHAIPCSVRDNGFKWKNTDTRVMHFSSSGLPMTFPFRMFVMLQFEYLSVVLASEREQCGT